MNISKRKLPFWTTFKDAHILIGENFGSLVQIMLPYLIGLIILSLALNWFIHPYVSQPAGDISAVDWGHILLGQILALGVTALVAVAWHRFLLLQENPSGFFNKDLLSEYWIYFSIGFLICASVLIPLLLATEGMEWFAESVILSDQAQPSLLSDVDVSNSNNPTNVGQSSAWYGVVAVIILCVVALPLSFVPARLSLALPASAIGRTDSSLLRFSWRRTRGNYLRFYLGMMLTFWPLIVGAFLTLHFWNVEKVDRISFILLETFFNVIYFATGILWVTFLSVAYRHFSDESLDARTSD